MPELPEIEFYRRFAEQRALNRPIVDVDARDEWFLKKGATAEAIRAALVGETLTSARRKGKLMAVDTSGGAVLGLRFGMSGHIVVDDDRPVDDWQYAPTNVRREWDRFAVLFEDGGRMAINDARRLGGVELDPDEEQLGPDALDVTVAHLQRASKSRAPIKAWIMDQANIAGVGNLIADEVLWRSGLDPARPANSLDDGEIERLHEYLHATVSDLIERGGSHKGDLSPSRIREGHCPNDGTPLQRRKVGGRTTYSCPKHQV
jgi:formamidopyrimidine-DNA glycosylase